eukprot:gene26821-35511_t
MSEKKPRKTLVELAGEANVKDPAAHAKHQVSELDKTAKRSQLRRKQCQESIEADQKEIAQLEEQINMLRIRYDPLCENLKSAKIKKQELMKTLGHCVVDQKEIMNEVKGTVQLRRVEESKFSSKMGSMELEMLRGYTLRPDSTFHQSGSHDTGTATHGFKMLKSTYSRTDPNSIKFLPPLSPDR